VRKTILFLCLVAASAVGSHAQDRGFGAGVILGEPTGLSGKLWLNRQSAVDMGLAYSFRNKGNFHLHADYLFHFPDAIASTERIPLYVGIGGRLAVGRGDGIFGVRIPLGISYWLRSAPLEFFLEVAPILDLAPATELRANGGIGARFFFN
jgi:hypothetical protein